MGKVIALSDLIWFISHIDMIEKKTAGCILLAQIVVMFL